MYDSGGGQGSGCAYGCDWPYPHYEAEPATVDAAAALITKAATSVHTLTSSVSARTRTAAYETSGSIAPAVAALDRPAVAQAQEMSAAGILCGACVVRWAQFITDHNAEIDRLNTDFGAEHESEFGVRAADYSQAENADDRAAVDAARTSEILAKHRTRATHYDGLVSDLRGELGRGARAAARLLGEGPTDEVLLALFRAGAMPPYALTVFPGVRLSNADYRRMVANLRRYGGLGAWLQGNGCRSSAEMKLVLDVLRGADVHPSSYADLLRSYWLAKACEKAGIDLCSWDTSLGADAMLPYLVASYAYYGKLYLENPDFQWAGMAGMIGPTFAGGMFDLQMFRKLADLVSTPLDVVPDWAKGAVYGALPPPLDDLTVLAEMSEHDFEFFEESFLSMQKQIFTDQMPMHEAYMELGMDGIEEMQAAGLIDQDMVDAWEDIDSGDPDRVAEGNTELLYREQYDIIGDDYDDMRDYHGPVGEVMTYLMGAIGAPGIPGAQSLGEYDPLEFGVEIDPWGPGPHGGVEVETPLPAGNISDFETRWDLIENDTLPTFQDLMENDPELVEEILSGDVEDRIDDARLGDNIDDLLARLSDWDIDVDGGLW